jgi:hypothetical protein
MHRQSEYEGLPEPVLGEKGVRLHAGEDEPPIIGVET